MSERKALVVGINGYAQKPLNYCVKDAEEIAGVLGQPEYDFEVEHLLNEQATRRTITAKLQQLFSGNYKFIIFYFSGHGVVDKFGAYLAPIDTDSVELGVNLDFLRRLIQNKSNPNTMVAVFLDCCHSGAADIKGFGDDPNVRGLTSNDVEQTMHSLGTGNTLIAACQAYESSIELGSLQHGIFTYHLLDGMCGNAVDVEGKVTIHSLYDYVSRKFDKTGIQKPVFKGDVAGRIVLAQGITPSERSEISGIEAQQFEYEAERLMNEYIQVSSTDIDTWKTSAYRDACSSLLPKLKWFERRLEEYPQLQNRPRFKSAYSTAQSKLADLGRLMEGLNTKIGVVERKLGSGTFGTVWQVSLDAGIERAYKVYHPTDLENNEKLARFLRGYEAMEQLDHPHIVKVHEDTGCPVGFVMDFIDGPNLRNFAYMQDVPAEVFFQLLTVAETLKHAHSRGVIHRDVKPENIIMSTEEEGTDIHYRPHLTDFDLAWFSTATQFTKEGLGSLIYAAPEQLAKPKSKAAHDVTTDVYAFGQLCFFFICKSDPVPKLADNKHALEKAVSAWGLEEPASRMVELYTQCTNEEPKHRVQDFREICDRLYEINQLLSEFDHTGNIGFERFARQLVFSIIGLSPEMSVSDTAFYTKSGQTWVNIEAADREEKKTQMCFEFRMLSSPIKDGASSYDKVRSSINRKIDAALSRFPKTRREAGKQGVFNTRIYVEDITMNIDGVELCRQIITRVIDCLEGN